MSKLKDCYQKQLRLYQLMFDMGLDEQKAIQEKDFKRLAFLLHRKQEIIQKIENIKKQTLSCRKDNLDTEVWSLIKKLAEVIKKIIIQEEKNESLLQDRMDRVFLDLKHLGEVKKMQRSYKQFSQINPHFLDQRR